MSIYFKIRGSLDYVYWKYGSFKPALIVLGMAPLFFGGQKIFPKEKIHAINPLRTNDNDDVGEILSNHISTPPAPTPPFWRNSSFLFTHLLLKPRRSIFFSSPSFLLLFLSSLRVFDFPLKFWVSYCGSD